MENWALITVLTYTAALIVAMIYYWITKRIWAVRGLLVVAAFAGAIYEIIDPDPCSNYPRNRFGWHLTTAKKTPR